MTIKELQFHVHQVARDKGWYDSPRSIGEVIALMHSELSEALEEYREGQDLRYIRLENNHKPVGFATELADVVIRVLDTAEHLGIDLEAVIAQKMAYNEQRPYRHGGKSC